MNAAIIYNSIYPEVAAQAARCLESFRGFSGWEPELFEGCSPATLADWDRKFKIGDGRAKTPPADPRYPSKKACFYSHFALWNVALHTRRPLAVIEYDTACMGAWTIKPPADGVLHLSLQTFARNVKNKYGRNWPEDAELLGRLPPGIYNIADTARGHDKRDMPGNTAYLITPSAAAVLIEDCIRRGWKQNDNLMTQDKFPLRYLIPSPVAYLEEADRHTSHLAQRFPA